MKIGFISDTHGSLSAWNAALDGPLGGCDVIIHCGDVLYHGPRNRIPEGYDPQGLAAAINGHPGPIVLTRGNCDAEIDGTLIEWPLLSPYAFLQIEGLRLLALHEPPADPEALLGRYRLGLLVHGHTHSSRLMPFSSGMLLNPGSAGSPKDGHRSAACLHEGVIRISDLASGEVISQARLCCPRTVP